MTAFDAGALALAALFLAAVWLGPDRGDLNPRQAHHGYWGAALYALARLLGWSWVAWVGLALLADDALQHAVQRWLRRPAFRSPVHRLYGLAWRLSWVRRLNAAIDRLLGA